MRTGLGGGGRGDLDAGKHLAMLAAGIEAELDSMPAADPAGLFGTAGPTRKQGFFGSVVGGHVDLTELVVARVPIDGCGPYFPFGGADWVGRSGDASHDSFVPRR